MTEAEKLWREWDGTLSEIDENDLAKVSRDAYKAALRREIEKMDTWDESTEFMAGCEIMQNRIIKLLDTVEP